MQGAPEKRAAPRTSGRTQASALRSNAADGALSAAWADGGGGFGEDNVKGNKDFGRKIWNMGKDAGLERG
jgi:hypothetical protein